jgi:hypothetical protein
MCPSLSCRVPTPELSLTRVTPCHTRITQENLGMPMIFTLVTAAQEWLAARLAAGPAAAGAPRVCMCVVVDGASREVGAPGAHATPAEGASQPPPNALPEGRPTHLPPPPLATPTPPPPTPTHTPGSGADPEAEEKRRREEEEAARAAARAHGTPVTIEAFNAWRARYDAGARVCVCVCVCVDPSVGVASVCAACWSTGRTLSLLLQASVRMWTCPHCRDCCVSRCAATCRAQGGGSSSGSSGWQQQRRRPGQRS